MTDDDDRRIGERDCLQDLYRDLCATARRLPIWDADARAAWVAACGQLLAVVPSLSQRVAWAYGLARALYGGRPVLPFTDVDALLKQARREEADR